MSKRFFVDAPISQNAGEQLSLDGSEAHHLIHVMRGGVGDKVILFDGSGREFMARITELQRRSVHVEVLAAQDVDRELAIDLTIAIALPKSDRQKVLIEKLTEIGTTCVVPLITERSVAIPKAGSLDRLSRAIIEASKQCGRNRLMRIEPPRSAVQLFGDQFDSGARLIASTSSGTTSLGTALSDVRSTGTRRYVCAVGPEGGFTDQETAIAIEQGWRSVTLGKRILRAETAAISIAATIAQMSIE